MSASDVWGDGGVVEGPEQGEAQGAWKLQGCCPRTRKESVPGWNFEG